MTQHGFVHRIPEAKPVFSEDELRSWLTVFVWLCTVGLRVACFIIELMVQEFAAGVTGNIHRWDGR